MLFGVRGSPKNEALTSEIDKRRRDLDGRQLSQADWKAVGDGLVPER
jgi:hypothetical protein